MASGDRFYELELRHRPAFWGDIGSILKIEGLVVGGEGAQVSPSEKSCRRTYFSFQKISGVNG
jgi:hypothetical protein